MKQVKIFCEVGYSQLEKEVNLFLQEIQKYNGTIHDIKFTEVLNSDGNGDFSCLVIYSKI